MIGKRSSFSKPRRTTSTRPLAGKPPEMRMGVVALITTSGGSSHGTIVSAAEQRCPVRLHLGCARKLWGASRGSHWGELRRLDGSHADRGLVDFPQPSGAPPGGSPAARGLRPA